MKAPSLCRVLSASGFLLALGCASPERGWECDCAGNSAPGNLTITGPLEVRQNQATDYQLTAVDPEADAFTFSTTTANAVIHGATLTFTPLTAGPVDLIVIATDTKGTKSAPKVLAVTVLPSAPIAP